MKRSKTKIKLSEGHLLEQFEDALDLLFGACVEFDKGKINQFKTIGVQLRILLHESKNCIPLLHTIGVKTNTKFYSTNFADASRNIAPHLALVKMRVIGGQNGPQLEYLPAFNFFNAAFDWLSFDDWWTEIVIDDKRGGLFSRSRVVSCVADQDGGAHVDPSLADDYFRLSRMNSLGIKIETSADSASLTFPVVHFQESNLESFDETSKSLGNRSPVPAAIRQIAYEVFVSLRRVKMIQVGRVPKLIEKHSAWIRGLD